MRSPVVKLPQVMLIDDDEADLFLHQLALEESGVIGSIVAMQRATDALSFLRREPHEIAVIFLDINMPVMDGFRFLEAYAELSRTQQAPAVVVILTSSLRRVDRERAEAQAAVRGYLSKPLSAHDIRALLVELGVMGESVTAARAS